MPAILAVAATVAVVLLALNRMAADVDATDSANIVLSTRTVITEVRENLSNTAQDYGIWDEAYKSLSEKIDLKFAQENLTGSTATGTLFEFAQVVDLKGNIAYASLQGKDYSPAKAPRLTGGLDLLLKNAETGSDGLSATGFLKLDGQILMIAVSPILPSSTSDTKIVPAHFLTIGRILSPQALDELGKTHSLEKMRMIQEDSSQNPGMAVRSPDGALLGSIVSQPRDPGKLALENARSPTLSVLALLLLVVGFLLATIWKTLSAMYRAEEVARHDAYSDALSGLPNRASFQSALDEAYKRTDQADITVAFMDLDGFKDVNDTYGHEVGDRLIRAVGAGFNALVGDEGVLARLGGDEFAALLIGPDSIARAVRIGESMIQFLAEPFDFEGRVIQVGASIGVTGTEDERVTSVELVRRADVAMYEAKSRGKNRVEIYLNDFDAERTERASIAQSLRQSVLNDGLTLNYQPVIDAASGRVIAVEALLRWIRPGVGPVSPSVFIPIAEETGLIEIIGAWVLRRACQDARAWGDLRIAVNISAAQFGNPNFDETVATILKEENFPAHRLELDITESYLIAYPDRAQRTIAALRALGVGVALDDFGTGFSSIGYLKRFAFDKLKIDRSIVLDIVKDPASQKMVQATIALADALGVGVTAEGIEHEDEAMILKLAGCHELQGYHFGSPTVASEITRRITTKPTEKLLRQAG